MVDASEHCGSIVRAADRARYLAALLAPEQARPHLLALYAFDCEVMSIRAKVSEPMAGEIRLQWWRDTIDDICRGKTSGHPTAAALGKAIAAGRLPQRALDALLNARIFDLYDDPPETMASLEAYFGETHGAIVQFACLILSGGKDPRSGEAAGHAGVALGLATVLRDLAGNLARGQAFLSADMLARHDLSPQALRQGNVTGRALRPVVDELSLKAGRHLQAMGECLDDLPDTLAPAFVHFGVVPSILTRVRRRGHDPLRQMVRIPPLLAQWRVFQAAAFGRY